jgi:hypothetical protein
MYSPGVSALSGVQHTAHAPAHTRTRSLARRRAGAPALTPGQCVVRRSALRARGEGSSSVLRAARGSFWMRSRTILYLPICRAQALPQRPGTAHGGQRQDGHGRGGHRKAVPLRQLHVVDVIVEQLEHPVEPLLLVARAPRRGGGGGGARARCRVRADAQGRAPPVQRPVGARGRVRRGGRRSTGRADRPPQPPPHAEAACAAAPPGGRRRGRRQDEERQQRRHGRQAPCRAHARRARPVTARRASASPCLAALPPCSTTVALSEWFVQ